MLFGSGAKRLVISIINGSDLYRAMDGLDLYAFKFNSNHSCRNERPDAARHRCQHHSSNVYAGTTYIIIVESIQYRIHTYMRDKMRRMPKNRQKNLGRSQSE
ncbi:hypothetical protein RHMOL_Rhmol01G0077500 [Rhododendron molle]|uniref:Uncharacterized protein n=1 Tax=Rhododendron molle TaxID=49168 RepID=A0ACC0PZL2_RHOML|nr:hypothetical protein RHMOL_Rhmol01G0077500 [Rhododendron molle]